MTRTGPRALPRPQARAPGRVPPVRPREVPPRGDGVTKGSTVSRHGREVGSVFDLVGSDENALTAALGFVLGRSPELLRRITLVLLPGVDPDVEVAVRMETRDEAGRTDLELEAGSHLAVVEAKRGWLLPEYDQLAAYAPRVKAAGQGVLATLSDASPAWAAHALPADVAGVPVRHLGWGEVRAELDAARAACRGEQRLWLDELHACLRRAIKVRDPADSWTYCVVISRKRPGDGGRRTFRDFVDQGWYSTPSAPADGRRSRRTSSRSGGTTRSSACTGSCRRR